MNEEYRVANIMEDTVNMEVQSGGEKSLKVAGVAERFIAILIDFGIVLAGYGIALFFLVGPAQISVTQMYWLIASVNIPFILYMTLLSSGGRNTIGKKLGGIRVEDRETREPLTLGCALKRTLGYYLSALPLMCGFLLAIIDDKHRSLHDFIAHSVVVEARHKTWAERTALMVAGIIMIVCLSLYFYFRLFGHGSLEQQRLISQAEAYLERIAYLENVHYKHYGYYTNDLLRLSILSGDPVQFQRDTRAVLSSKDFRIGIDKDGYKISARAKDDKQTRVYWPKW